MNELWIAILPLVLFGVFLAHKTFRAHWFCRVVGHQPPVYAEKGWWSPGEEYGILRVGGTDGIGRTHCCVEAKCARCKAKFTVARVHLP